MAVFYIYTAPFAESISACKFSRLVSMESEIPVKIRPPILSDLLLLLTYCTAPLRASSEPEISGTDILQICYNQRCLFQF